MSRVVSSMFIQMWLAHRRAKQSRDVKRVPEIDGVRYDDTMQGAERETVWDYPRPPRVEPCQRVVRVEFNGRVLAEAAAHSGCWRQAILPRITSRKLMFVLSFCVPMAGVRSASTKARQPTGISAMARKYQLLQHGAIHHLLNLTIPCAITLRLCRARGGVLRRWRARSGAGR